MRCDQCPLLKNLFGSFSDREHEKINPLTKQVLALEPKYQAMSDPELQAQTPALKENWLLAPRWRRSCRMLLPSAVRLLGVCWA